MFDTLDGFKSGARAAQELGLSAAVCYLIGEERLHGKAAVLSVSLDAGHAVLLGFRPEWRGQAFGAT